MPILRSSQGIWCDICKYRWPAKHPFHSKPASWTVVSESMERKGRMRHYCQSCAQEASVWWDGSIWELQDQIDFACENERLKLDV